MKSLRSTAAVLTVLLLCALFGVPTCFGADNSYCYSGRSTVEAGEIQPGGNLVGKPLVQSFESASDLNRGRMVQQGQPTEETGCCCMKKAGVVDDCIGGVTKKQCDKDAADLGATASWTAGKCKK